MPLDLESYPPEERKRLIELGRHFGSADTVAQAEQTLNALKKYENELRAEGFVAEDAEELREARERLLETGVLREDKEGEKKTTRKAYLDALKEGKALKLRARTILTNVQRRLAKQASEEARGAYREIETVLGQTRSAGADANALAGQLDLLREVLESNIVAAAAAARGGAEVTALLSSLAPRLRDLSQAKAGPRGTPQETELIDLLDGIIIELVRDARRAARAASGTLGQPAIAKEFELNKLYGK